MHQEIYLICYTKLVKRTVILNNRSMKSAIQIYCMKIIKYLRQTNVESACSMVQNGESGLDTDKKKRYNAVYSKNENM